MAMLQRTSRKLVVILMRDPYDKTFLRTKDAGLTAFGFRRCQIEAVVDSDVLEASSPELDDLVRLTDRYGRS